MKAARHADFARLIAPHADALFRAAYRLTGNRADAEDLVQDVCVRAFANLPTLETLERPKAWLNLFFVSSLAEVKLRLMLSGPWKVSLSTVITSKPSARCALAGRLV